MHLTGRQLLITGVLLLAASVAAPNRGLAVELDIDLLATQAQFRALGDEAGLALGYPQAAPAEALGFPGFDVGIEATVTPIDSDNIYWQLAFSGDPPDYLPVPRLRARVALPFGIDVGAVYAKIPYIVAGMIGGEIKWSVIKGGVAMPAVAVRGAYSTLLNVDELGLTSYSADVSVSKGFLIFTPYLGVGQVWTEAEDKSTPPNFNTERHSNTRMFVGLQIGIPLIRFTAEAAFAEVQSYTARLSAGF